MHPDPERFVQEWLHGWNSHDLDAILAHYRDDMEMSSPYIAQMAGVASGRLKGKAAVRAYWAQALQKIPDLRFEHVATYVGAGSLALQYHGALGKEVVEVFEFDAEGRVARAAAHYR
jgi:hypothetical protein